MSASLKPARIFRAGLPGHKQATKVTQPGKNFVSFVCFR
jgi:hypothetical protein